MNIAEYISTGILEAYALGELSDLERREVERNISLYPELRLELTQIEIAQEKFLVDMGVQPRLLVKEKLLQKVSSANEKGKVVEMKASPAWWKYSLAASIVLTLVSSFLAYRFYYKWRESEGNLLTLLEQNQRIASEYNTVNQRLDKIEADLKITNNPGFKRTVLSGTKNSPESLAYVYWNEATQDVYLSIENMRALSQTNQYQLWAIVDGKPVDAGVFDSTFSGLLKMKNISGAVAFAVTVEPRGGKASPSLETMQVIGNVVKG